MFKWFMAKTLVAKIIIVTSTVVVVGGATAGAILIPKYIETKKEEQRQEQIRQENEADLANISINLKTDKITIPLNGVTQGFSTERYYDLEEVVPMKVGNEINKEQQTKVLTETFIENNTGGELTVEVDPNLCESVRGDYNITFTVTSEKGNKKSKTATITVWNYVRVAVGLDKTNITIAKGTNVDIMQGVTYTSNLPEEEQGHIETEGTVDVNTVGTYTIKYKYVPKEGTDEGTLDVEPVARTYNVIEPLKLQANVSYSYETSTEVGSLHFSGNKFTWSFGIKNSSGITREGTYTIKGNNITLNFPEIPDDFDPSYIHPAETVHGILSDDGKSIILNEYDQIFYLN